MKLNNVLNIIVPSGT